MIEKKCQHCHVKYEISNKSITKYGDFCSPLCRNLYLGKTIKKTCETCNKDFYLRVSYFKNGEHLGRFCSKNCYDNWQRRNQKIEKCKFCDSDIIISTKNRHIQNNTFCGKSCYAKYRQRNLSGKYVDGDINANRTYRILAFENNKEKCCSICGYDKLPEILQVHHKDGNRLNNEPVNLEILCPNCHYEKHYEFKKQYIGIRRKELEISKI